MRILISLALLGSLAGCAVTKVITAPVKVVTGTVGTAADVIN